MKFLDNSNCRYDVFQRHGRGPGHFIVLLSSESKLDFVKELSICIMFLGGAAVLQKMNAVTRIFAVTRFFALTRFSAATFSFKLSFKYGQFVEGKWLENVVFCSLVYSGYPHRLQKDQGFEFTPEK